MNEEFRAEIEALAQQVLEIPRVVTLTPLDQPDRGWCPKWPGSVAARVAGRVRARHRLRRPYRQRLHRLWGRERRVTRLRAAVDLLTWPLLTTLAAVLPRRWGRWLREAPEPEVIA